jgi:hypothetical protein
LSRRVHEPSSPLRLCDSCVVFLCHPAALLMKAGPYSGYFGCTAQDFPSSSSQPFATSYSMTFGFQVEDCLIGLSSPRLISLPAGGLKACYVASFLSPILQLLRDFRIVSKISLLSHCELFSSFIILVGGTIFHNIIDPAVCSSFLRQHAARKFSNPCMSESPFSSSQTPSVARIESCPRPSQRPTILPGEL